jgi:hypothetical protein
MNTMACLLPYSRHRVLSKARLLVVVHGEEALRHIGGRGIGARHLDQLRVLQVARRQRLISGEKVAENSKVWRVLGR